MCKEVQQKAGKCTPVGYAGLDNQKWYIYGRWNGEYYLRPKNSDKVLDVSNNGNAIGTNVQIWDKNDTAAQRFSIYKHPKAGSSVLTVSAGDSNTFSTLSWTAASDTTSYNVRITMKNESTGEYAPYRDFGKRQELHSTGFAGRELSCVCRFLQ